MSALQADSSPVYTNQSSCSPNCARLGCQGSRQGVTSHTFGSYDQFCEAPYVGSSGCISHLTKISPVRCCCCCCDALGRRLRLRMVCSTFIFVLRFCFRVPPLIHDSFAGMKPCMHTVQQQRQAFPILTPGLLRQLACIVLLQNRF